MDTLASKVGVVTGAASGIGLAMARSLGREGMRLVLADIDEKALQTAVTELRSVGVECVGQPTDVRDAAAVEALAQAAVDTFGGLHVACNNAGVSTAGRQWQLDVAEWAFVLDVCLWGVINGVRSFVPRMLASDEPCHIVNTGSMGGFLAAPFVGPYGAAKAAVVSLTRSLRIELEGTNVGLTLMCPGMIRTPVAENMKRYMTESGEPAPDVTAFVDMLAAGLEDPSAMEPAELGALVVQAVKANQFWLLPNGETLLPIVQQDHDELFAAAHAAD
jgi:NAD(P)-dependent dehydrogenase (short-subunit alcohol dehydrogenase family)